MSKISFLLISLFLVGVPSYAQLDDAFIKEFEDSSKKEVLINEETFSKAMNISYDFEVKAEEAAAVEKQLLKEQKEARLMQEVHMLDSITQLNRPALIDSLIADSVFKELEMGNDTTISKKWLKLPLTYYELIDGSPLSGRLSSNYEVLVFDNFEPEVAKAIQIPSIDRYKNRMQDYADLLLELIDQTLIEKKETLKITKAQYLLYEASKKISNTDQLIKFRYQFLTFVHAKK